MNVLYKKILDFDLLPRWMRIGAVIGINWSFQSLLYMDRTERVFKLSLDVLFISMIFFIANLFIPFWLAIPVSFIVGHSLNWLLNGHLFGLLKTFEYGEIDSLQLNNYMADFRKRLSGENSIAQVLCFGSLSRGEINNHSDLDVRVIRKKGFINGIKSCNFVFFERCRALFLGFPLDIYVLDDTSGLSGLRDDEIPIQLL
jgi:predicted nucleotidyltransferase